MATCQWIDPLTDDRWRRLVERHPSSSIFQSRGWLHALRRVYGYEPLALATVTPRGTCTGAILFCRVKSWVTGSRLVSLPFSDHCDPLFEEQRDLEQLLDFLSVPCKRWKYVELRPRGDLIRFGTGFVEA